jgi:hypothetical protein
VSPASPLRYGGRVSSSVRLSPMATTGPERSADSDGGRTPTRSNAMAFKRNQSFVLHHHTRGPEHEGVDRRPDGGSPTPTKPPTGDIWRCRGSLGSTAAVPQHPSACWPRRRRPPPLHRHETWHCAWLSPRCGLPRRRDGVGEDGRHQPLASQARGRDVEVGDPQDEVVDGERCFRRTARIRPSPSACPCLSAPHRSRRA